MRGQPPRRRTAADRADDPRDDLDVITRALIIVAANLLPLIWLLTGSTEISDLTSQSRGLLQGLDERSWAQTVAVGYMLTAMASILMAAFSLVGLVLPAGWSLRALRAAASLLGTAIVFFAVFLGVLGAQTPSDDWVLPAIAGLVTTIGVVAWWIAGDRTNPR